MLKARVQENRALRKANEQDDEQLGLPAGWTSKERAPGGPLDLARHVFRKLNAERMRRRHDAKLKTLEKESADWPSAREFLRTLDSWLSSETGKRTGSLSKKANMLPDPMIFYLKLQDAWRDRAALLPRLCGKQAAINQWVDAAFFWVMASRKGELEEPPWPDLIEMRIKKKGKTEAGLRLFLREGFETLAGKDRGKKERD